MCVIVPKVSNHLINLDISTPIPRVKTASNTADEGIKGSPNE